MVVEWYKSIFSQFGSGTWHILWQGLLTHTENDDTESREEHQIAIKMDIARASWQSENLKTIGRTCTAVMDHILYYCTTPEIKSTQMAQGPQQTLLSIM